MRKFITSLIVLLLLIGSLAFTGCTSNNSVTLFISKSGSDTNSGSKASPFATLKRAVSEIEKLAENGNTDSVTVIIGEGEYSSEEIILNNENIINGIGFPVTIKPEGNCNVVFSAGKTINRSDFVQVTDEIVLSRFSETQKKNVRVADLSVLGLTKKDIGELYSMGAYGNGKLYENGEGNNADLFRNGVRLTNARWPNDDFVIIKDVIDIGDSDNPNKKTMKDPKGGIVTVEKEVIEHISHWAEPEKVWAFGYFYWDWADQSTPVKGINAETSEISFSHLSSYGYKENQYFYFYNVLEELDTPNEYYIDRDEMKLYCYFDDAESNDSFMLTVCEAPLLSGSASDIVFENIGFKGVRGDIVVLEGDNITFRNCTFSESYGNAVTLTGYDNLVYGCEVMHMGKGGILLTGGDRETLTPGNNVIENCEIHDFGELFRTYQKGAYVNGVGNKIIHNELYNTPHMALSFGGNDNLIAFNYIHDTSYEVNDGGSLYAGRSWSTYGNVIENNFFENIVGIDGHRPEAIYLDDALSGITVRNNIVKNCDGYGILLGGGHDLDVENNILINCYVGIYDDGRTCTGEGMDATDRSIGSVNTLYLSIENVSFFSDIWKEKYPVINIITTDVSKCESPEFIGNPSRTVIKNNFYAYCEKNENIFDDVRKMSDVKPEDNFTVFSTNIDLEAIKISGKFLAIHNIEGFSNPDITVIGRYKEANKGTN